MKKKIAVLLSVIAMSFVFVGCAKTYSINDYYSYEISGYDGRGRMDISFKDLDLAEVITEEAGLAEEDGMKLVFAIDEAVDADWSKTSEFANGDVVEIKFNQEKIDKFNEENKKCKLQVEDIVFTVSGLDEIGEMDPFDGIDIQVTGMAPAGEVTRLGSPKYQQLRYVVDKPQGLSNGDVITISLDSSTPENFYIDTYGALPSVTSMEYTVEGLDEYVTEISQLSDDVKKLLISEAENHVSADKADDSTISNRIYDIEKMILLTPKNPADAKSQNIVYVVYSQSFDKKSFSKVHHIERYMYMKVENIVKYADGTVYADVSDAEYPSYSFGLGTGFEFEGFNVSGYENYDKLYNDLVTANAGEWNAEVADIN